MLHASRRRRSELCDDDSVSRFTTAAIGIEDAAADAPCPCCRRRRLVHDVMLESLKMPPPAPRPRIKLWEMVQPSRFIAALLMMPPPLAAVVRVAGDDAVRHRQRVLAVDAATVFSPPPLTELPVMVQPLTSTSRCCRCRRRCRRPWPSCRRRCSLSRSACPRYRCRRRFARSCPPEIVRPESVAVVAAATWKTWTAWLPLIVRMFAPGPWIISGPAVSESTSVRPARSSAAWRRRSDRTGSGCRPSSGWCWPD